MKIRDLFDESKNIDRRIEKVVTYGNDNSELLHREISEYIVTKNIEDSLSKMLDSLDSMGTGSRDGETCFWVSGFYGSGKSSLTKYLGFALDPQKKLNNQPFLQHLSNQISEASVRGRLQSVAKHNPMTIIMLDLATQHNTDIPKISDILYWHVMRWAGYSNDIKIAYLEKMLEEDSKEKEFQEKVSKMYPGQNWDGIKNKKLIAKTCASTLASEFYSNIWSTPKQFNDIKIEEILPEDEKIKSMLQLIQRVSKQKKILFILDEVGQYAASDHSLILNLDGLAKNIKLYGGGNAFLIATAQQTLTEKNPEVSLNSANLFKLKDRFPISIVLQSDDIKEITYKRLLTKSANGEKELNTLFQKYGASMTLNTQLNSLKQFYSKIEEKEFRDFYPFLPHHFDILMSLIDRLAKSSGGKGLRSALRVIQDILLETSNQSKQALADMPVGTLVNAVVLYDILKSDIHSSFKHLIESVNKVTKVFEENSIHQKVSKAIVILQIISEIGVNAENISSILYENIASKTDLESIKKAIEEILKEPGISLNEVDGSLRFMSEAINEFEKKKQEYIPRSNELVEEIQSIFKEIFKSFPSATIFQNKKIETGIEYRYDSYEGKAIEGKEINTIVEFASRAEFQTKLDEVLRESANSSKKNTIYWLAERVEIEKELYEMVQCNHINKINSARETDLELRQYLSSQKQRANRLSGIVEGKIKESLKHGTLVFRRQPIPTINLGDRVDEIISRILADKGKEIYERYSEANIPGDTRLAEHFLQTERLDRIKPEHDPLGFVIKTGTSAKIHQQAPSFVSIQDYLKDNGRQEGRQVLEFFSRPPFGWSPDACRYIIAAMLTAGMIKVISGSEEFTVRGDRSLELLKNPTNFRRISIELNNFTPPPDWLNRAKERLIEITGEEVLPLPDIISKTVVKKFPDLQREYAHHEQILKISNLPGVHKARNVQDGIANIIKADASQAYSVLGPEHCPFFENLKWASKLQKAFDNGIQEIIRDVQIHFEGIQNLPDTEILVKLKIESAPLISELKDYLQRESFFDHKAELGSKISDLKKIIETNANLYYEKEKLRFSNKLQEFCNLQKFQILSQESKQNLMENLESIPFVIEENLDGILKFVKLVNEANAKYDQTMQSLELEYQKILQTQEEVEKDDKKESLGYRLIEAKDWPKEIQTEEELDQFIQTLEELRSTLKQNTILRIIY